MTPANAAKSTSVTPGTEFEHDEYTVTALSDMTTIETFLAGATALIQNGAEMQEFLHGKQPDSDLLILQGLMLIHEAVSQVNKTRRLLDEGIVKGWIAEKKLLGVVAGSKSQGSAA